MDTELPRELLERYLRDPVGMDGEVRSVAGIPEDRYYTVSVFPKPGVVSIGRERTVPRTKISKSDHERSSHDLGIGSNLQRPG